MEGWRLSLWWRRKVDSQQKGKPEEGCPETGVGACLLGSCDSIRDRGSVPPQ